MDVREYVGIPFKALGRDRSGCDCYGLVRLVLLEQCGVALPLYNNDYVGVGRAHAHELAALIDRERPLFPAVPVEWGAVGDIVLMRVGGHEQHVGLVVAPGVMLHTEEGCAAVTERMDSLRWRHRIVGFYRVVPA